MSTTDGRTIAVTIGLPTRRPRSTSLRELGCALHPESVTEAWYSADCPPKFDPRTHGISWADYLRWRMACVLRGAHA